MKNYPLAFAVTISLFSLPAVAAPSGFEAQVFEALNAFRQAPSSLVPVLEGIKAKFQGNLIPISPGLSYESTEGAAAVEEALQTIRQAPPPGQLAYSDELARAAQDVVKEQVASGTTGHVGADHRTPRERMERYARIDGASGENIQYGFYAGGSTGRDMIVAWVIDDGVKPRPHRLNLLNGDFKNAGLACGQHPQWGQMCTLDLAEKVSPK